MRAVNVSCLLGALIFIVGLGLLVSINEGFIDSLYANSINKDKWLETKDIWLSAYFAVPKSTITAEQTAYYTLIITDLSNTRIDSTAENAKPPLSAYQIRALYDAEISKMSKDIEVWGPSIPNKAPVTSQTMSTDWLSGLIETATETETDSRVMIPTILTQGVNSPSMSGTPLPQINNLARGMDSTGQVQFANGSMSSDGLYYGQWRSSSPIKSAAVTNCMLPAS